jgi:Holliday junction resolvase RusA-like endonuclease
VTDAISFILPFPPSVNSIRTVARGRMISSSVYRDWQQEAGAHLVYQGFQSVDSVLVPGQVEVEIEFGRASKRNFDIDNHAKPILDLLVTYGVIEDDNNTILTRLSLIARERGLNGACVTVIPIKERVGG